MACKKEIVSLTQENLKRAKHNKSTNNIIYTSGSPQDNKHEINKIKRGW